LPGNPYAGTEWAQYWDQGFAAGFADPNPDIQPPAGVTGDPAAVWREGAWAAQQTAKSSLPGGTVLPGVARDDAGVPPDGSLPSLRLPIPDAPIGGATVDVGVYILQITFGLRGGNVTVDPPNAIPGVSLDPSGYRVQVQSQLEGLFSGIRLNGIAGTPPNAMSIGTTWGNEFWSNEVRVVSPTQLMFIGQANLPEMALPTDAGDARVRGQFGFYLSVEILPKSLPEPVEEDVPWYESAWDWVGDHAVEIVVGVVVVGVIVVQPEAAPGVLKLAF
jgi:hypothetical protein